MGIDKYVYSVGDATYTAFISRIEKQSKGFNAVSLSNYDATGVCVITDGSTFEIAGSMYLCTTDTSIGGSLATGICYIMATGASTTAAVAWSTTAPVWRDDFQGYYATVASSVRALGGCNSNGANCKEKWLYHKQEEMNYIRTSGSLRPMKKKTLEIGDWNMDTGGGVSVAHGLVLDEIKAVKVMIRIDTLDRITPLDFINDDGFFSCDATEIDLTRTVGGYFDADTHNATSFNRGWIRIEYEDAQ